MPTVLTARAALSEPTPSFASKSLDNLRESACKPNHDRTRQEAAPTVRNLDVVVPQRDPSPDTDAHQSRLLMSS